MLCGLCHESPAVRGGRCWNCYQWMRRHGDDEEPQDRAERRGACSRCHDKPVFMRGRCSACYRYLRRTGTERPAHLIQRSGGEYRRERQAGAGDPENTLTWAEWCAANGYDPRKRTYA